jgi:tRNA dimethylallyltransferase
VAQAAQQRRQLTAGLPVVVILGPTASGKTALSLALAPRFDAEVVSADSRYLYRGMDIGTAKPSTAERGGIRHHLIDVTDPDQVYPLSSFLDDAYRAVEAIGRRGRLPLVVGGTPLYLRAFIEGWRVPAVPPNEPLRAELDRLPTDALVAELREVDPVASERIGVTNRRRMIRALEVWRSTGRPLSELEGKQAPPYRFLTLGLRMERATLHQRIEARARWMFGNGLLDEASSLLNLDEALPAITAIGYPEARAVVRGEIDLDEALERTRVANHRYVRHQETWFRRFPDVVWLEAAAPDLVERAAGQVERFLMGEQIPLTGPDEVHAEDGTARV